MPFDMEPFTAAAKKATPEPVKPDPASAFEALLWVIVVLLVVCSPAIVVAVWSAAL